jgi:hypothetical protein
MSWSKPPEMTRTQTDRLAQVQRVWRTYELPAVALATGALVLGLLAFASLFVDSFLLVRPGDAQEYMELARAPLSPAMAPHAPFKYRVLAPFLVWFLPTEPVVGFALLTLSALWATGVVFYYYLRELGFDSQGAVAGLVLFIVSPAIAYHITNVVLVDAVAYLFLVGALWAAARNDLFVFAVVLAVGVAAKAVVLFALPIYALFRLRATGSWGFVRTLVAGLPAGAVLLGLRLYYGFGGELAARIQRGIAAQLEKLALSVFYLPYEVYSVFGTLWLLALLCSRRIKSKFLQAGLLVAPLAFLQPLIARDVARVLFIIFPIVIPAALSVFDGVSRRITVGVSALAGAAAIAGIVGAFIVLPVLAGNVVSVSLPTLQFLALVAAVNELAVIIVLFVARRRSVRQASVVARPQ